MLQTTVLDGRTGEPLLTPYMKMAKGVQASPLTVSLEGQGNDLFLFFASDCEEFEGNGASFGFLKGTYSLRYFHYFLCVSYTSKNKKFCYKHGTHNYTW